MGLITVAPSGADFNDLNAALGFLPTATWTEPWQIDCAPFPAGHPAITFNGVLPTTLTNRLTIRSTGRMQGAWNRAEAFTIESADALTFRLKAQHATLLGIGVRR